MRIITTIALSYLAVITIDNNQNQNAAPYFSRLKDIVLVRYVDQVSEERVKWSDELKADY